MKSKISKAAVLVFMMVFAFLFLISCNGKKGKIAKNDFKPNDLGKKVSRENFEKNHPKFDQKIEDYYEKGDDRVSHDGPDRAKWAEKAAKYLGPKNGYKSNGQPKPGGGKYAANFPKDPDKIAKNAYKWVEDLLWPKKQPNATTIDSDIFKGLNRGDIDIGKEWKPDGKGWMCIEHAYFLASLMRELGFKVREKNVLPSISRGRYDVQTAAINVWYKGKWHFFDPFESFTTPRDYLRKTGHAGYGPYHDYDMYYTEGPVKYWGANRRGRLRDRVGWKKFTRREKQGFAALNSNGNFRMRLVYNDNRTGWNPEGDIFMEISNVYYTPYDNPTFEAATDEKTFPRNEEILYLDLSEVNINDNYMLDLEIISISDIADTLSIDFSWSEITNYLTITPPGFSGLINPGESVVIPIEIVVGGEEIPLPPEPVDNLQVEEGVGEINLIWDTVKDAVSYNVYQSLKAITEENSGELIGSTEAGSYNITDLNSGQIYFFAVKAVGANSLESGLDYEEGSVEVGIPN